MRQVRIIRPTFTHKTPNYPLLKTKGKRYKQSQVIKRSYTMSKTQNVHKANKTGRQNVYFNNKRKTDINQMQPFQDSGSGKLH